MEEKSSNESSSHMSIFDESINDEENVNNENENKNEVVEKEEEKILKFQEKFLAKKRKPLSEEEKKERIEKTINRYCKRNDEMIQLLEKINNDETTHKNINRMMRLLAIDLSDTKKLRNRKALIFNQKKEIFQRLLNLTFEEYQLFWYKLTDGKLKKGNAQHIKSSNISKAKEIIKSLEEKKNEVNKNDEEEKKKENSKNNKTIKEIIQAADLRDIETEKFNEEILGTDNDISDDSLSSSSSDFDEDIDNNSNNNIDNKEKEEKERKEKEEKGRKEKEEKERKEKEEKERKEKEEKERKEKEEKERKEKENKEKVLKQSMEEKDEIDIFN